MRGGVEKLKMHTMKIKSGPDAQQAVALDIGTSKTAAIIGEIMKDGKVNVLGVGSCPASGLKRGVVVNIEDTVNSIRKAVDEVELLTQMTVSDVYVGISGSHIEGFSCDGQAAIKHREVSQADMDSAMATAQAMPLRGDQQVIHALPRDYSVDGQGEIKDPLGMSGYRLHANAHIVTGAIHQINNVKKCVQKCGLNVSDIVLEQIASGYAVLEEDEKELGVCLLDIGGGTTDIIVFNKGAIAYTVVIPFAGQHVTNDIALVWRTPTGKAEEMKLKYGCALKQLVGEDETIEVPGIADRAPRSMKRRALVEIIQSRYEEIFSMAHDKLREQEVDKLAISGFVLTGGGSKIEGVCELAENVFNAPVRIGQPKNGIEGLADIVNNPVYATGVGILRYVGLTSFPSQRDGVRAPDMLVVWGKIRHWFANLF